MSNIGDCAPTNHSIRNPGVRRPTNRGQVILRIVVGSDDDSVAICHLMLMHVNITLAADKMSAARSYEKSMHLLTRVAGSSVLMLRFGFRVNLLYSSSMNVTYVDSSQHEERA